VLSAILVWEPLTSDYEVIVVNDGSTDYTEEILDELEGKYERVRVIHHDGNDFRMSGSFSHIPQSR